MKRALEALPKRGLLSWLREWADGNDMVSAANAFKVVCGHSNLPDIDQAKVIPTTDGMRALIDKNVVFLHKEEDIEIEGAIFVTPEFLAQPGVDDLLRRFGFRDLDPLAVLNARLARLSAHRATTELSKLWDAVLERARSHCGQSTDQPSGHSQGADDETAGGHGLARSSISMSPWAIEFASKTLDRQSLHARCGKPAGGRSASPVRDYPAKTSHASSEYREWVLATLNAAQGPGERPIENVEFTPANGPGPFSMLFILRDAERRRRSGRAGPSACSSRRLCTGSARTSIRAGPIAVRSPARWAVDRAGV